MRRPETVARMRRLPRIAFFVVFWAAIFVTATVAEETTVPLLTTDQVRSDYEALSGNWIPIPEMALNAIVAAEDLEFFSKPAQNSAITSQLGKRYITGAMRTVLLKVTVYYNATILARELTHSQILNWYAQEIYLGSLCFGLPAAAEAYFGKEIGALEVQDYALLAALIRTPDGPDLVRAPARAKDRRNLVVEEMRKAGRLTVTEADAAVAAALDVRQPVLKCERP